MVDGRTLPRVAQPCSQCGIQNTRSRTGICAECSAPEELVNTHRPSVEDMRAFYEWGRKKGLPVTKCEFYEWRNKHNGGGSDDEVGIPVPARMRPTGRRPDGVRVVQGGGEEAGGDVSSRERNVGKVEEGGGAAGPRLPGVRPAPVTLLDFLPQE